MEIKRDSYLEQFRHDGLSYRQIWKDKAEISERKPQRRLFPLTLNLVGAGRLPHESGVCLCQGIKAINTAIAVWFCKFPKISIEKIKDPAASNGVSILQRPKGRGI